MTAISPAEAKALAAAWTESNPFRAEAETQPTPLPSWQTMEATLRQWHEQSLNDPEYLWMNTNFEDMADAVHIAIVCANEPADTTPDNGWMARQDAV